MKVQYKIFTLVLTFVFVFGLAACGSDSGTNTPGTPTETAQQPTTPSENLADETPAVEDIARAPKKDLGGRDVRMLTWWEYVEILPDTEEPDPEEADNYYIAMLRWEHAMNTFSDYNASISNIIVGYDEQMEVLTASVLAGDPAGDLVLMDLSMILNAIIGNLLIPYEDFLPSDHDIFTTQDHGFPTSFLMNKTWTATNRRMVDDGVFLGVNLDIIRAESLENPAELYDRGEWTVEKMLEIGRRATRDTDGDGTIDQYGFGGQSGDILDGLIGANDGILVTEDLQYGYAHPNTMRALEFAYQIFNTDKSWNYDPNSGAEFWDWNRNTYAFREGRTCMYTAWLWTLPDLDQRTFDYTAVPFPVGPDNDQGHAFYLASFMSGVGVPRGSQNPEDAFGLWYDLQQWYGNDFELKDEEDLEWPYSKFNTLKDGERIMDFIQKGRKIDIGTSVRVEGSGYNWITGGFAEVFYNDTGTPAQVVEENRQTRQDMLNRVLGELME